MPAGHTHEPVTRRRAGARAWLLTAALTLALVPGALVGCGASQQPAESSGACALEIAAQQEALVAEHRNLHAVAWTQHAAEFRATAITVYAAAAARVDEALADPTWTAVVEQTEGFAALPPAIILDLDETVIDNSPYQAWLIATGRDFANDTWDLWCSAGSAPAIPGAVPFLQEMERRGVALFYVSNRDAVSEQATIDNLRALGLQADEANVMLRGELPGGSEKSARREAVAADHRVIMLFGDNLGDFVDHVNVSGEERDAIVERYASWWGERWFMLPNPQYGSWVRPAAEGTFDAAPMLRQLRVWDGEGASP